MYNLNIRIQTSLIYSFVVLSANFLCLLQPPSDSFTTVVLISQFVSEPICNRMHYLYILQIFSYNIHPSWSMAQAPPPKKKLYCSTLISIIKKNIVLIYSTYMIICPYIIFINNHYISRIILQQEEVLLIFEPRIFQKTFGPVCVNKKTDNSGYRDQMQNCRNSCMILTWADS